MRERARKMLFNSILKIEATKGREMNTSKPGKTASQPTPSVYLYPSVQMGTAGACTCAYSKVEQNSSEREWEYEQEKKSKKKKNFYC